MNGSRRQTGFLLGLYTLLFCAPLHADEPFDFEVEIRQQRITLKDNTQLETNSFGINYSEYSGWPLILHLALGQSGADHNNDETAKTYSPGGYYAGLGARLSTAAAGPAAETEAKSAGGATSSTHLRTRSSGSSGRCFRGDYRPMRRSFEKA